MSVSSLFFLLSFQSSLSFLLNLRTCQSHLSFSYSPFRAPYPFYSLSLLLNIVHTWCECFFIQHELFFFFSFSNIQFEFPTIYIYIYMHMCVYVCACVSFWKKKYTHLSFYIFHSFIIFEFIGIFNYINS